MSKKREKKITASHFYRDVVIVLAEKAAGKANTDVPSKEVIPIVLSRHGLTSLGASESRKDGKDRAILLVEWAFRNQRAKHKGKKGVAFCKQGSKRGMWALTENGITKALEWGANLPEPKGEAQPDPEPKRTQRFEMPQDSDGFTPEELQGAADRVRTHWQRLVARAGLGDELRPPVFELTTRKRNWGCWNAGKRLFAIDARLAVRFGHTYYFTDTVAHELAHQYVSEVVKPRKQGAWTETAHGPSWKAACKMFGADPKATAKDRLDSVCASLSIADEKILERVKKLLALGDSPESHEAELATLRAHELMRKHHIDSIEGSEPLWDYQTLGKAYKQRPGWLQKISCILSEHYNVECIWLPAFHPNVPDELQERKRSGQRRSLVLEITGSPANVAIAAHVYDFLVAEGERRLSRFREEGGGTDRTARLDFLEGLYQGFRDKLLDQEIKLSLRETEKNTLDEVNALVVSRDEELRKFYKARYPHTQTTSRRGRYTHDPDARSEGHRQGRKMSVRDAVSSNNRNLALPSS